jgi:hypothetical protein
MQKLAVIVGVLVIAAPMAVAENVGSTFGSLSTAQTLAPGHTALGAQVGVADATSFYGSVSHGISSTGDGRLKIGFFDRDLVGTQFALGADMKWQLWDAFESNAEGTVSRSKHPFDMALGPFVEWFNIGYDNNPVIESQNVFQVGLQMLGSYPIKLEKGGSLSPYGRVNARFESIRANLVSGVPSTFDTSEEHLALGLNGGVSWHPRASSIVLFGEFQIDGNDGVFFGIDYML